jgi:hypothetical protein
MAQRACQACSRAGRSGEPESRADHAIGSVLAHRLRCRRPPGASHQRCAADHASKHGRVPARLQHAWQARSPPQGGHGLLAQRRATGSAEDQRLEVRGPIDPPSNDGHHLVMDGQDLTERAGVSIAPLGIRQRDGGARDVDRLRGCPQPLSWPPPARIEAGDQCVPCRALGRPCKVWPGGTEPRQGQCTVQCPRGLRQTRHSIGGIALRTSNPARASGSAGSRPPLGSPGQSPHAARSAALRRCILVRRQSIVPGQRANPQSLPRLRGGEPVSEPVR